MNTSRSYSSENNQINNLSNHDNFFLDHQGEQIKIYPELVETAEHLVLWLENNPEFKQKITNVEYDMLIWDDVSGRPITLLIKYIIDHFRKEKWLKWGIDNIFIDNPNVQDEQKKNQIREQVQNKKVLISTEFIYQWRSISSMVSNFWLQEYDVFTQVLGKYYNEKNKKPILYYQIIDNQENIYNILWGKTHYMPPKIFDNTHWDEKNLVGLIYREEEEKMFSKRLSPKMYNQETVNNARRQIKLLAKYIIKNHLS